MKELILEWSMSLKVQISVYVVNIFPMALVVA